MKKTIIATIAALTLSAGAFATEVSVEVADLSTDAVTLAAEDIASPFAAFDMDVKTTQTAGDEADSLQVGLDYTAPVIRGVSPYASVDYILATEKDDALVGEIGASYDIKGVTLDAYYDHELTGDSISLSGVSVAYQVQPQLGVKLEHNYDFDASKTAAVEATATYDFTDAVYAEASYEFEADTAGVKVGYKF